MLVGNAIIIRINGGQNIGGLNHVVVPVKSFARKYVIEAIAKVLQIPQSKISLLGKVANGGLYFITNPTQMTADYYLNAANQMTIVHSNLVTG